jgi:hypothetical protein
MGIMAPPSAYASGDEELSRPSFVCEMVSKTLDNFLVMEGGEDIDYCDLDLVEIRKDRNYIITSTFAR